MCVLRGPILSGLQLRLSFIYLFQTNPQGWFEILKISKVPSKEGKGDCGTSFKNNLKSGGSNNVYNCCLRWRSCLVLQKDCAPVLELCWHLQASSQL
jgi:hypothetical protein